MPLCLMEKQYAIDWAGFLAHLCASQSCTSMSLYEFQINMALAISDAIPRADHYEISFIQLSYKLDKRLKQQI